MTVESRASTTSRRLVVLAALCAASCGSPLMKLPSGPGSAVPAQEAAAALTQATSACRALRTLTAEIAVSGSAGGHRLRGRLSAGVSAPASARLEAVAPFGPPLFIFVATGEDATLLLPRDQRVLEHGRADAVLDAVAGVPLGAADLEATLTGCTAPLGADAQTRQFGDTWQQLTRASADEIYLQRDAAGQPWRLAASIRRVAGGRAWRTEYRDHQNGLPRTIRVTSIDAREGGRTPGTAFDLQMVLSQVETNVPLGADAFTIQAPASSTPISLEELRRSGPLAPKAHER